MSFSKRTMILLVCLVIGSGFAYAVPEVRLKEIAAFAGIRENQLTGIGLV
ncbi:MAG TPA: flagellar biosynthesis protein FlgI, partial [Spirochaetia bacterium]|nr:flagellar biosynthesis protein FlgI [Spirochaetia bacterium]